MAEVTRKREKPLQVNPFKLSQPMGATLAFLGIDRCMPLMHGGQGCTSFTKVFFTRHFCEPIAIQTSAVTDAIAVLDGGGLNAGLRDMARFGEMMRNNGRFGEQQIIPQAAVQVVERAFGLLEVHDDQVVRTARGGAGRSTPPRGDVDGVDRGGDPPHQLRGADALHPARSKIRRNPVDEPPDDGGPISIGKRTEGGGNAKR